MLIDKIKEDLLQARKNRNSEMVTFLTTIIGEADTISKNEGSEKISDSSLIKLLTKFKKNNDEVIKIRGGHSEAEMSENVVLESYLPKQLSEEKIRDVIQSFLVANTSIDPKKMTGAIMGVFKENYAGSYDGATVSRIIKEELN